MCRGPGRGIRQLAADPPPEVAGNTNGGPSNRRETPPLPRARHRSATCQGASAPLGRRHGTPIDRRWKRFLHTVGRHVLQGSYGGDLDNPADHAYVLFITPVAPCRHSPASPHRHAGAFELTASGPQGQVRQHQATRGHRRLPQRVLDTSTRRGARTFGACAHIRPRLDVLPQLRVLSVHAAKRHCRSASRRTVARRPQVPFASTSVEPAG